MISYWGIDHGSAVSKAYIPGRGWVPAVQAGKEALRGAQGGHKAAKGVSWDDKVFQANQGSARRLIPDLGKPKSRKAGGVSMNSYRSEEMPPGMNAFAFMTGKNNRHMVTGKGMAAGPKWLKTHEQAHLTPKKRTAYRLNQITSNPRKTMREEARADMAAGKYYRKGQGTTGSGYAEAARRPSRGKNAYTAQNNHRSAVLAHLKQESPADYRNFKAQPNRADMFGKRPLADYRKVQDRIAGTNTPARTYKPRSRQGHLEDRAWANTRTVDNKAKPMNPNRPYMDNRSGFTRPQAQEAASQRRGNRLTNMFRRRREA